MFLSPILSNGVRSALLLALLAGCVTEAVGPGKWAEQGRVASGEGDWRRAQELWSEVLAQSRGQHPEARLAMGEALLNDGRGVGCGGGF